MVKQVELLLTLKKLIKTNLKIAEKNIKTIMPGFTHLKNAQALSLGHYLMSYVEMFTRDRKRFLNNLENLNEDLKERHNKLRTRNPIEENFSFDFWKF